MDPLLLRHLWRVIETAKGSFILSLDDSRLVQWLLEQLAHDDLIDIRDSVAIRCYIQTKLSLIRDLAHHQEPVA